MKMWRKIVMIGALQFMAAVAALLSLHSCQCDTPYCLPCDSNQVFEADSDFVAHVLLHQLKHGAGCEYLSSDSVPYVYTRKDALAAAMLIYGELQKFGYTPNRDSFSIRLKAKLGIDVSHLTTFPLYDKRSELYLIDSLRRPHLEDDIRFDLLQYRKTGCVNLVFDPGTGLIFPMLYVPEIVDYKEVFPTEAEAERHMNRIDGLKWCDDASLDAMRSELMPLILHYNRFILEDDERSLDWLVQNCPEALQSLFVDFHLEDYPKINATILDRVRFRNIPLEILFAEREPNGKIYIRKGLMDFISRVEDFNAPRYQSVIRQTLFGLLGRDVYNDKKGRFPQILIDSYSLDERRYIVSHMMNMLFPLYNIREEDAFMVAVDTLDPDFLQYAIDHDFFGLPELRTGISIYLMREQVNHWKMMKY